jgi:hypothetical protein
MDPYEVMTKRGISKEPTDTDDREILIQWLYPCLPAAMFENRRHELRGKSVVRIFSSLREVKSDSVITVPFFDTTLKLNVMDEYMKMTSTLDMLDFQLTDIRALVNDQVYREKLWDTDSITIKNRMDVDEDDNDDDDEKDTIFVPFVVFSRANFSPFTRVQ